MPESLFWNVPRRVLDYLKWRAKYNGTTPEEEFLKLRHGEIRTRIEFQEEAERISAAWRAKELPR